MVTQISTLKGEAKSNPFYFIKEKCLPDNSGVPAGVPTYQYAAVPVGYQLPNVPYVKLEELFLPVEAATNGMITMKSNNQSLYAVSAQTLASESECGGGESGGGGGVEDEDQYPTEDWYCGPGGPGTFDPYDDGYNFRAHGRITAYDNTLGTVGVEGLRVRAYRWFTTYNGFTDANGYYSVDGTFTGPPNYWMNFERYEFSVNDGSGGPREVGGPQIRSAWNLHFSEGVDKFCSEIFRAAYHYYYKDIQGLQRPPENGFWNTQVKLGAFNYPGTSNTLPIRHTFGLGELIKIYNPQNGSRQTYATTIHELGHASHLQFTGGTWADNEVCESWARGVEWVLTRMEYPNYPGGANNITNGYTNVVIDMIDDDYSYGNLGYVDNRDLVTGYNIVQIQNSLFGGRSWNAWKENIKNNYDNNTKQHLDALFNAWSN